MATKTEQGLVAGQVYTATHKGEPFEAEVKEIGGGLKLTIMDGTTEYVYDTFAQAAAGVRGYNTSAKGFWKLNGAAEATRAPRKAAAAAADGTPKAERKPREARPIPGLIKGNAYGARFKKQEYTAVVSDDLGTVTVYGPDGKELGSARGLQKAGKVITGYEVAGNTFWAQTAAAA